MDVAAVRGNFLPEFQAADKFYSTGIKKFENAVIKKLADVEPEKLASEVLKPRSAESVKQIREVVGEKAFASLKRRRLQEWVDNTLQTDSQTGDPVIVGKTLLNEWKKLGRETRNAAFSAGEQAEVSNLFSTIAKINTKRQPPGLWGMTQVITAGGAGLAGGAGAGVGLMVAPYMFAKLIANPAGRRWLTEGFRIRPGTQEAVKFMSRFGAWLAKENQNETRERSAVSGKFPPTQTAPATR